MQEFYHQFDLAFEGFPKVLEYILSSLGGAIVAVIIYIKVSPVYLGIGDAAGHFLVCWLTGGVLGPTLFVPMVQAVVKLPSFAGCFLSSGMGWWFWTVLVAKKQADLVNKKTPDENGSTQ